MRDPDPELAHPEAAGWVLGTLDPDDAEWFAGHLPSCPDCRVAVAGFGPAARLLATAAPACAAAGAAGPDSGRGGRGGRGSPAEPPVARLAGPDAGAGRGGDRSRGHQHRAAAERRDARAGLSARAACRPGAVRLGQRDPAAGGQRLVGPAHRGPPARAAVRPVLRSAGGSGRATGPVIPAWSARAPSPSARPGPRPYSCGPRLIRTTSRPSRSPWTAPPGPASPGGSSCPAPPATTDPGPATWRRGRSPAGPARRAARASHGRPASSPSPAEARAAPRSGTGLGSPGCSARPCRCAGPSESSASRTIRPDRIWSTLSSCGGRSPSSSCSSGRDDGRLRISAATLRPMTSRYAATLPRAGSNCPAFRHSRTKHSCTISWASPVSPSARSPHR